MNRTNLVLIGVAVLTNSPFSSAATPQVFSQAQICRATIGAVMGRDPKTIMVNSAKQDDIYTSYIREDDGTEWNNRCRVDVSRVYWATANGRWRVHPLDAVITYSSTSKMLTLNQKFNDGSSSTKSYTRAQLGPD